MPTVTSERLRERLDEARARVARAAARVGRDPADVEILPVTKGHPVEMIPHLRELGVDRIAENRVDEAERKRAALGGDLGLRWHMVGHLQRNKARDAVGLFDVIESVDSLRLARRLDRMVERLGAEPVEVLVQVNASGEEAKSGFAPEETPAAVAEIGALAGLRVAGLMTMAPFTSEEAVLRATFRATREALARCVERGGLAGRTLSMGMSNDYEIAVEEGSTRVRLGTALLGERPG